MAKDHLQDLIAAVAHLHDAVKNMGENFSVASIDISDGRNGHHFDAVIRSSPSFLQLAIFPDARNSPQVREIMGVKIKAI